MRLIDADFLKNDIIENHYFGMFTENVLEVIDNAPSVDLTKNQAYDKGFITAMKLYTKPQSELAVKVWELYEKNQSHLATHVSEFGDELKELLGEYQNGGGQKEDCGKWIFHADFHESIRYGCNQCGNLTNIPSNFCPNCGKRMKKYEKGGAEHE